MVKKGELFNAYSSYFDILENVGQYPQGDANRLILLSFLEQMKADGFYNTLSAEDRKVIDKIIDCIRKKLCILPYTSACMKKKAEKVYIGEYEDCIFYNKTIPEYEDMNPSWELLTVACQINPSTGYRTGRKISTYQNVNPLFKGPQTYTKEVIDTSSCPYNAPNWVEESRSCEQSGGTNTGYMILVYRDNNINSESYGQTKTQRRLNTSACPMASTDPMWVEISRACKTISYEHSSDPSALHTYGVAAVTYRDVNPLSPTPEAEREYTTDESDSNCPEEYIGYLTFSNGQKTKMVSSNSAAYSTTIPLNYYINDLLQNSWNSNVIPYEGDLDITTHDGNCTVTISAPKNTTGQTRTFVGTIGANYFSDLITFTLVQAADAVFKWSNNTLAKTDTAVAAGVTKNYTVVSTAGGEFKSYSVSSTTSGISVSISNNTVTVTVAQNPNTSARTLILKLKQQGSNNEITLTVQQEAAAQPQPVAVFTVSPASLSFTSSGGTKTLTVNSKVDNVIRDYSITNNFSNATVTKNGSTVTVTANSTSTALSGNILLTQTGTGNTITVPVTQAAPVYTFTWGDGTPSQKTWANIIADGDSDTFTVISRKDNADTPFTAVSSSWITATVQNGSVLVTVSENESREPRTEGVVTLSQTGSTNPNLVLRVRQLSYADTQQETTKLVRVNEVGSDPHLMTYMNSTTSQVYYSEDASSTGDVIIYIPVDGYFSFTGGDYGTFFEDTYGERHYAGERVSIEDLQTDITLRRV